MATCILCSPGTEFGPCKEPCNHSDCQLTRRMAEMNCGICRMPIGYETRYYDDDQYGLVHALCLEEALDHRKNE